MSIKKSLIYSLMVVAIISIAVFLLIPKQIDEEQRVGTESASYVLIGETKIDVEIADTSELRAQGLSKRPFLGEKKGMLFVFEEEGVYPFWMKGMNFPIDIIWINKDFVVVDITENATPESYPQTFSARSPIKYALEVNAGLVGQYEIGVNEYTSLQLIDIK